MASECTICKGKILETGNYSVVILPARRIPLKAKKLSFLDSSTSVVWGLSKFQKYLLKRAVERNYCEIKCKTCGTKCKIPMTKRKKTMKDSLVSHPVETPVSRKKRKKMGRDVNAGLIIPSNFRASPWQKNLNQDLKVQEGESKSTPRKQRVQRTTKSDDAQKKLLMTRRLVSKNVPSSSGGTRRCQGLDSFLNTD